MRIMIPGSGGREHALAASFIKNSAVEVVYCVPGNGGTEDLERCKNVKLAGIEEIERFCIERNVDLVMPGSEKMLVEGIVDRLSRAGIKTFGPDRKTAMLEGSKTFAKGFMHRYGVRTCGYRTFDSFKKAAEYLSERSFPVVLKADGLAAGKGVFICQARAEAKEALSLIMVKKQFGKAGDKIVMEDYLEGFEVSIHCLYDGKTFLPLISARDHKRIGEGNTGPNTGGMGVVVPNPGMNKELWEDFNRNILSPTAEGISAENMDFRGVIFFGIMVHKGKCYLLEYNMRMGDPETQGMLALLDHDFTSLVMDTVTGNLKNVTVRWKGGTTCCVVLASEGYPGPYKTGFEIKGISQDLSSTIYLAGVDKRDGKPVTSGGRVMNVTAAGADINEARALCYRDIEKISFKGMIFRRDIGL